MYVVENYLTAVLFCIITMVCWGSWANTQKLASESWSFTLFYWDYSLGIIILSLLFGLTFGSSGATGQSFIENLSQSTPRILALALMGGVLFNLANLLLVVAIDLAGMAVAFPIGIGLALVLGVFVNFIPHPGAYNSFVLFAGVGLVVMAIVINALVYKKMRQDVKSNKGIFISLVAGLLMSFFYRFVAESMSPSFKNIEPGTLTPYTAVFVFSMGVFISSFLFNTILMKRPVSGPVITFSNYFKNGSIKLHAIGILGGVIWCMGMLLSIMSGEKAGYAISYGLGQGATLVAAIWGVFVWKEFKNSPKGTNGLLTVMFLSFLLGLSLIIIAKQ
ncbi:multidrug DMT transporter permease [Carboxylicivirga mesophila]|uniref:Multidrug DMT transporter permease n=1 Tax=Carboxylicivirga mesophila TaxID=1166478 RepID=A0ABS5K8V1_9BACT|nr:GRP family sugar transporter [Carboxylicivirga mesophila]MBS2211415.1 multidrug DMT transporter permease [Carboxylicivirga mesophila]